MNGSQFYDDEQVFNTYRKGRQRADTPNDTLERPVIMELLGSVAGKRILDLGCGDAAFGQECLALGCSHYVGVEGSRNMVAAARTGPGIEVIHAQIETWDYPTGTFDQVVSRLALHYIEDIGVVFTHVHRALVDGGQFVFSMEHPVITSSDAGWQSGTVRGAWLVDNYFDTGQRVTSWMGGTVIKYHRTVEDIFVAAQQAGFVVEHLREARPRREHFTDEATYERRKRIPLFLILSLRKRG